MLMHPPSGPYVLLFSAIPRLTRHHNKSVPTDAFTWPHVLYLVVYCNGPQVALQAVASCFVSLRVW